MMIIVYGILGWFGGALVNYLADVLPYERKFVPPFCVYCKQPYHWKNYLFFPRRCVNCGKHRPVRVYVTEIIFVLISIWLGLSPQIVFGYWGSLLLFVFFGVVVVIDVEHRLILHPVSLAGVVVGVILGVTLHGIVSTLAGGLAGFFSMLGLYYFGEFFARAIAKLRGVELDEVALGFGDVNLAGILGLLLGMPGVFAGLLIAILIGGFVSLLMMFGLMIAKRYKLFTALPYGPFLVISAIILLYFKEILLWFVK